MRLTIRDIQEMKRRGERIPMLTAYDYTTAKLLDEAGIPLILVGDSLGQVVLGYDSTIPVTLEDMLHHTKAVVRGARRALVVADMPFMTYAEPAQALANAARLVQEAGAGVVKVEGGRRVAETVRRIVEWGIPVMGHIGLTPQSVHQLGGYRVQGRSREAAAALLADALALEAAGAFALVLELVPIPLARLITQRLRIPTIGIGAGPFCDGQVQVIHDMLGLYTDFVPKHCRRYADLAGVIREAVSRYGEEVRQGSFPSEKESFSMDEALLADLQTAA
ncbi:MAG: 3-methyl-2-oxobutanoate hydroxymethyltransferase [Dehalococcoidia bacterium]